MPTRRLLVALATLSLIACNPPLTDGGPLADSGVIGATADEIGDPHDWPGGRYAVRYPNALGDSITGVLALPPGNARVPAVMVLHGSGGLFRPDDGPAFDPATAEFERQFREWEALLTDEGYASFFPASFSAAATSTGTKTAPTASTTPTGSGCAPTTPSPGSPGSAATRASTAAALR